MTNKEQYTLIGEIEAWDTIYNIFSCSHDDTIYFCNKETNNIEIEMYRKTLQKAIDKGYFNLLYQIGQSIE